MEEFANETRADKVFISLFNHAIRRLETLSYSASTIEKRRASTGDNRHRLPPSQEFDFPESEIN